MQLTQKLQQARKWCNSLAQIISLGNITYTPIVGDAGFREYIRLTNGNKSYILVYAPPATEKNKQFYNLANVWSKYNIHVPRIHAYEEANGFMLLDDLGSNRLIDVIHPGNTQNLYSDAIDMLIKIQQIPKSALTVPEYDAMLVAKELDLFLEWFIAKYLSLQLTATETAAFNKLRKDLLDIFTCQQTVVVHRDFHSKNILLNQQSTLGTVDFQDAVVGPASYDLVSLLKDCYVNLPEADEQFLLSYYLKQAQLTGVLTNITLVQFIHNYQLTGVQRHLKALGIFARLYLRDNKDSYLEHIPRTAEYIIFVLQNYKIYTELIALFHNKILPRLKQNVYTQNVEEK